MPSRMEGNPHRPSNFEAEKIIHLRQESGVTDSTSGLSTSITEVLEPSYKLKLRSNMEKK